MSRLFDALLHSVLTAATQGFVPPAEPTTMPDGESHRWSLSKLGRARQFRPETVRTANRPSFDSWLEKVPGTIGLFAVLL